jgi:bacteriocin-like protein
MSDQEKKQEPTSISPRLDAENKEKNTELSEEQLNKVTGGREPSTPSGPIPVPYPSTAL